MKVLKKLESISLFDVQGVMVFESNVSDDLVFEKYHFDLPDLAEGIYFVKMQLGSNTVVKK